MTQFTPHGGHLPGIPTAKKSRTGLWVGLGCGCIVLLALIVGGIILAFALMSGNDSKESGGDDTTTSSTAPDPSPQDDGQSDPASAPPSDEGGDERTSQPAPTPEPEPDDGSGPVEARGGEPQKIGDAVLVNSGEPHQAPQNFDFHSVYQMPDGTQIEVGVGKNTDRNAESVAKTLPNPQKIGKWTCAVEESSSLTGCITQDATHGYVAIGAKTLAPNELAAWGDELLGAFNEQQ